MRPGFFLILALLVPLLASAPALAQPVQPLDRLLPQIRRSHPGQFYDADGPVPGSDGRPHYHLKWMTPDGRILWLDTDARTGRVLGTSPGRDQFDGGGPGYSPGYSSRYAPGHVPGGTGRGYDRGYERGNGGPGYGGPGYGGYGFGGYGNRGRERGGPGGNFRGRGGR